MPNAERDVPEDASEPERAAQYLVAQLLRRLNQEQNSNAEWNYHPETESPTAYLDRLKKLFPEPAQVYFLEAFWQAIKVGHTSAISALIQLVRDKQLQGRRAEYYPLELNASLIEIDRHSSLEQARICLAPERAVEVMVACNQAIYHLQALESQILDLAKKSLRSFLGDYKAFLAVKGVREKLAILSSTFRLITTSIIYGQEEVGQKLDEYVEKHVTPQYIGLRIGQGIDNLEFIRDHITQAFDPFEMSVYITDLEAVLYDLALPPEIADHLYEAAEVEFEDDAPAPL